MPVKLVDVDIHELKRIEGLDGYDAVEILFRAGREPLGRARVPCNGNSLDAESIRPLIEDLPSPEPLDIPGDSLSTISVAICTMNRIGELRKALHSLARQERPADEILVIDNGCQDEVRELVTQILPDARYLQEPCVGLDFARNRALSAATGDIIAFLDDDAVADSFWVQSLAECFAEFPGAGAATGLVLPLEIETDAQELFEANGGFARGFTRRILPKDGSRRFGLRLPIIADSIGVGSGCNMAFRTTVAKVLQGFDEALDTGSPLPGGGDFDMIYRIMRAGYELVYEPRAFVRHRHRRSQAEVQAQLAGHYRSLTAFLIKSLGDAGGRERFGIIFFLIWRLSKVGFRIIRRLIGRDVLPIALLASMFKSGLVGIGSYHASKRRIRSQTQQYGGGTPKLSYQLGELWRYRELLRRLVLRNLMVKYQRSLLGFVWTLLNPLATLAVLTVVFTHVVRIPVPNYWAFLLSGYFVWNFVITTLNAGTYIFAEHSRLLRSVSFPSELIVFSAAIAKLIEFGAAMLFVFIAIFGFHHQSIPPSFIFFPLLIFFQLLMTIGLALPITSLSVFYYDAKHALPIALATLFYASPVFYPVSLVPDSIRSYYLINPIAGLLKLYHIVLYEGNFPPIALFGGMFVYSVLIFLVGYALFRRYETVYAEVV